MNHNNEQGPAPADPRVAWDAPAIWAALAHGPPDDELEALRWRLLNQWTELHDLKCACDLSQGQACCLPVPAEIDGWLRETTKTTFPMLRVAEDTVDQKTVYPPSTQTS